MFFKKKKSGIVEVKLREDQFCSILEDKAEDVKKDYCFMKDTKVKEVWYGKALLQIRCDGIIEER